jgi:outer membrane protein OmpU
MKKVLFATTALIATAGVAMANDNIAMSGTAEFGIASEAGGASQAYSNANLKFTMSGTTDSGWTFGTSMDASAGKQDYDPGDFEFDGKESGVFGLGAVFISGAGLTVSFDADDIDDAYDDDNHHDMKIAYTAGPLSVAVTYDVDSSAATNASYDLGFSSNGISLGVTGNDADEEQKLTAGYEIDSLSVGIEYDLAGADEAVTTLSLGYAMDSVSLGLDVATDDTWEVSASTTMGAITAGIVVEDDNAYEVTGSYNLGGGASIIAGINDADSWYMGTALKF